VRHGSTFRYFTAGGRRVTNRQELERIRALVIPPAWDDVWICSDSRGHLQATGRDARGRKQYRYHPNWRTVRDEAKYGRMIGFAQACAQEADGRQPDLGVVLDQLHHRPLRQRHGLHAADGGGPGRALAAVQGGDLPEDIAGPGVREGQLPAVAGENRQPNAPLQHQIDLTARVAAREDHLIRLEVDAPHAGGDGGPVRVGKGPE